LSGELISAFLYAQLEKAEFITNERLKLWDTYHAAFSDLKDNEKFTIPSIPNFAGHNGHIFYLILKNKAERDIFINKMHQAHINCVFHYVPLHSSIGGRAYGRVCGDMINTEIFSERLVRLPLWINLDVDKVISSAVSILKSLS
jgi:dTDP-4-amino-4,6-dideoxygalactose transaminase